MIESDDWVIISCSCFLVWPGPWYRVSLRSFLTACRTMSAVVVYRADAISASVLASCGVSQVMSMTLVSSVS